MYGYAGKCLIVDLSAGTCLVETLDAATAQKWVGGSGVGTKYLVEALPKGVKWSDPENLLTVASGPLGGSGAIGAGTINITTAGPLTGAAGISQANGFMGAYMKFSGFDAVVLEGRSDHLVYVVIKAGAAEIRDARHLAGMRVEAMEDALRDELGVGEKDVSVYGIGPAGENRVHFAAVMGDRGHAAGHNGLGAVMGAKRCKAIVAYNAPRSFEIGDPEGLKAVNKQMLRDAKAFVGGRIFYHGTSGGFETIYESGQLPIKNYTETTYDHPQNLSGLRMREIYDIRSRPCYKCPIRHVKEVTVTEGPYQGLVGEEPEYEQLASWGPQIGNNELGAVVMLTKEVDNLGLEANEAGWVVGWAMECFEKGVFTLEDTEGIDLGWGNVEGARALLNAVARREGRLGNLLADGVKRASMVLGGEAAEWAIYTQKGATPRAHDHRARWSELFDTCVGDTGTLQTTWGGYNPEMVDMAPAKDPFSHEEVATLNATFSGFRQFEDCLGYCKFCSPQPKTTLKAVNCVTGWGLSLNEAQKIGLRINHALRVFSLRQGLDIADERPSKRYGSVPRGGPCAGKDIMAKWDSMRKTYYTLMGWDPQTGRPLDETLREFGLEHLIDTF